MAIALLGYVPDRCGCCQVCARSEFELCDISPDEGKFGICGDNLNCVEYQVTLTPIALLLDIAYAAMSTSLPLY